MKTKIIRQIVRDGYGCVFHSWSIYTILTVQVDGNMYYDLFYTTQHLEDEMLEPTLDAIMNSSIELAQEFRDILPKILNSSRTDAMAHMEKIERMMELIVNSTNAYFGYTCFVYPSIYTLITQIRFQHANLDKHILFER